MKKLLCAVALVCSVASPAQAGPKNTAKNIFAAAGVALVVGSAIGGYDDADHVRVTGTYRGEPVDLTVRDSGRGGHGVFDRIRWTNPLNGRTRPAAFYAGIGMMATAILLEGTGSKAPVVAKADANMVEIGYRVEF